MKHVSFLSTLGLVAMLAITPNITVAAPEDTGPNIVATKNNEDALQTASVYLTQKAVGTWTMMEPLALKRSDTGPDIPTSKMYSYYQSVTKIGYNFDFSVNASSASVWWRERPTRTTASIVNYQHYASSSEQDQGRHGPSVQTGSTSKHWISANTSSTLTSHLAQVTADDVGAQRT